MRSSPCIVAFLSLCIFACVWIAAAADNEDPDIELKSFRVADGYEVNLFASELEGVVKPIQMRWDAQGRLWIVCSPSYPQIKPGEQPDDKLVIVEDSNGDGRADKSTVFASGLNMPLGLELGGGGAYVATGGELLHMKDTDGDGRVDQKRVILRGFFSADSHQNINNFVWSPGGELFFCQGLHAFARVETPWGIERLNKAGIWRFREKQMRLDGFLGDDMGPQNPYGITFDDWGQPIMVAGNGQGVYYLRPALIRTRHYRDIPPIWNTGAKFGGCDILSGRHLPDNAQGLLAAGSFMNNSVYWWKLTDEGSSFVAKDLPPLIVSTNNAFRPVDLKVGPDGAIYIADWYNPIIGHYQASFRHPGRDKAHGRIWRVTAKGRPLVERPKLANLAAPELLEQLRSPERWARYQSRRLLADMDPAKTLDDANKWLERLDKNDPQYGRMLIETLAIHETQEHVDVALLKRVLNASDYRARAYATGVLSRWHDRMPDALALLAKRAADVHPRVRLEAVVAASYIPSPKSIEVAAIVVDQPMDRFLEYALIQTTHALKQYWKPAFDSGELSLGGKRLEFVLRADGSADVLNSLMKMLTSDKLNAQSRADVLRAASAVGGPNELSVILNDKWLQNAVKANVAADQTLVAKVLKDLLNGSRLRKTKPAGDPAPALQPLLAASDSELRQNALLLAGHWRVEPLRAVVAALAVDESKPLEDRRAAFEALASFGGNDAVSILKSMTLPEKKVATRTHAASALSRIDIAAAAEAAAAIISGTKDYEPDELINAFLERQNGADALASALEKAQIPQDAAKLCLRALSSAGRQDKALKNVLSSAAKLSSDAPEYSAELVKSFVDEAQQKGDAARGEAVFHGAITNCLSCHNIGGAGGTIGPDLSAIGTGMPFDLLVEAVLWPNRQVKEGFMSTLVLTKDGQMFQGFRVSDSKEEMLLRDPNTNSIRRIPLPDIKSKKDIGSVMPEGLTAGLTRTEICDMIRFLSELGRPGPFRVENKSFVRRWQVLKGAADSPEAALKADAALWSTRYSYVSGVLPANEIPLSGWLRFDIDVTKAGPAVLRFTSIAGIECWIDGKPAVLQAETKVTFETGAHGILLRMDTKAGRGLSVECEPDKNAGAELQILNGR